jgi:hypothetical protein
MSEIRLILHHLAPDNFTIPLDRLAEQLHDCGNSQYNSASYKKACEAYSESLSITRALYAREPHKFKVDLALRLDSR